MALMTPDEYKNTRYQQRLETVQQTVAEISNKSNGKYEPRPLLTLEQYLKETEWAAALRVPLIEAELADISFLTCASQIKYIRSEIRKMLENPGYRHPSIQDTEWLAEVCLYRGLLVAGNFGAVVLAKTGDGFSEISDAMCNDTAFLQMYDIQNIYRGTCIARGIKTGYTGRTFNPKEIEGETHAEKAAEVTLMHYDIDPGNLVTLSVHGPSLGIAKVVLNTARLVKKLGLAVHFQEGVKPSREWPGVFYDAGVDSI